MQQIAWLLRSALVASYCAAAFPADWATWGGPFGTNATSESNLPDRFDRDTETNVRWSVRLGDVVFGCPTVSEGRVFVGTNHAAVREDPRFSKSRGGVLVCLDEDSGATIWSLVTPERTEGFPEHTHMPQQRWGICSSPAVEGDRVYIVTNGDDVLCLDVNGLADGNDGPFLDEARYMAPEGEPPIALNEHDADIIWRYDIPRELDVAPHDVGSCSVLLYGDVLYTSTSNGLGTKNPVDPLRPNAPAFIALDKRSGRLIGVEDEQLSERLFHAQWSSPTAGIVDGRALIFLGGGDGVCYAFEAIRLGEPGKFDYLLPDAGADAEDPFREGPLRMKASWRFDCNPPDFKFRDGKRVYYYQGDLRVYKNKHREGLSTVGFNSGDGSFAGPAEILASPVFYEGQVYVSIGRDPLHGLGRGILHCINAQGTGDIRQSGRVWDYRGIGRTLASVAVSEGLVYAIDLAGTLHCLDASTGQLFWTHDTREESWSNPLVADGKVYVNTKETFWIFAASREKRLIFNHRGGSECAPIAANGSVYAFMRGKLYSLVQPAN